MANKFVPVDKDYLGSRRCTVSSSLLTVCCKSARIFLNNRLQTCFDISNFSSFVIPYSFRSKRGTKRINNLIQWVINNSIGDRLTRNQSSRSILQFLWSQLARVLAYNTSKIWFKVIFLWFCIQTSTKCTKTTMFAWVSYGQSKVRHFLYDSLNALYLILYKFFIRKKFIRKWGSNGSKS